VVVEGWILDQVLSNGGRYFGLLEVIVRLERPVWVPAFAGMTWLGDRISRLLPARAGSLGRSDDEYSPCFDHWKARDLVHEKRADDIDGGVGAGAEFEDGVGELGFLGTEEFDDGEGDDK